MTSIYLSLGSNMGDRVAYLQQALTALSQLPKTQLIKTSSFYQTAPWGNLNQDDFINAVCQLETHLEPLDLLKACQRIEKDLNRVRKEHWGPRTIDIDILLYGQEVYESQTLTIPHPYMTQRAFVLVPLFELAGDIALPNQNMTVCEALSQLSSQEIVKMDCNWETD